MPISFPFFRQRDAMDCGPACLMMVAAAHGRKYPLPYLREHSHLSREGVSAQGIMDAAETVGFRTMAVKVPYDTGADTACLLTAPLPCVAHWNHNHMKIKLFDDLFLLQRLDQLIRNRATGTPCDLAGRLGTSKRDVYRLIGSLRDQGFPVAYDRDNATYYYEVPVKLDISIVVDGEKLLTIQGGKKNSNFFSPLPDFGSGGGHLCEAF